jgi:hypothetical protein
MTPTIDNIRPKPKTFTPKEVLEHYKKYPWLRGKRR